MSEVGGRAEARTTDEGSPGIWQDSRVPQNAAPSADQPVPADKTSDGTSIAAPAELPAILAARLKRDADGLVAAIVQQHDTGEVLMLGWMDDEALRRTLTTGRVTFWSRSRQEYWRKGDTSGHAQWVKSVAIDCDGDALLVRADQVGAACHTGARTCFEAGGDLGAVVGTRPETETSEEKTQ
ncbi:phosphoribosyl-AMP cyclohydrolase [Oerskovia sp. KBS0722]|nr:phosphoribosyl-AMP cyclohydrolase [Oerskovia sp. KBS0722]